MQYSRCHNDRRWAASMVVFSLLLMSVEAHEKTSKSSASLRETDPPFDTQSEVDAWTEPKIESAFSYQPEITVVESQPQRMVYGSISMPEGSPWCHGNATFWLVGHQLDETPYCYNADIDEWKTPGIAMMDLRDDLNDLDAHPPNIDRHDCTTLDVNKDGLPDIICTVGADKGHGYGYNELYLTQNDGSLVKVKHHGLQKYPTVRSRFTSTLRNTVDEGNPTHVFLSAYGTGRQDGKTNWHTMYRLTDEDPYFEEVPGPFNKHAKALQVTVADWNQDGRDDLIVLHKRNWTIFVEQEADGSFTQLKYPHTFRTKRMRSARVADVNQDGIPDLVVTTRRFKNNETPKQWVEPKLKVFLGIDDPERFDFTETYFTMTLPFAAPDVEILDVNSDGLPDLYVVQSDDDKESFCGKRMPWGIKPYPPYEWISPADEAQDVLLIGKGHLSKKGKRFEKHLMKHQLPGCGFIGERFGDNKTMILANGDEGHAGSQVILKW